MGNLEKLGILVMVILVVVVGVVAITPQERVAQALRDPNSGSHGDIQDLEEVPPAVRKRPAAKPPETRRWPATEPDQDLARGGDGEDPRLRAANLGGSDSADRDLAATDEHPGDRWRREFDGSADGEERNNDGRNNVQPAPAPVTLHREYTLKAKDRLFDIARRELGDGTRWQEIVALNPSLDPRRLPIGTRILLPNRDTARAASDAGGASAPAFKIYEVKSGETLSEIAAREYGKSGEWRLILAANRDQLSTPEELRIGMKLRIPAAASRSAPQAAPLPAPKASGRTYEVVRGDTLSDIARAQLGSAKRWREILKLNGLRDGNEIHPGMKLRLP